VGAFSANQRKQSGPVILLIVPDTAACGERVQDTTGVIPNPKLRFADGSTSMILAGETICPNLRRPLLGHWAIAVM
jgi:hypothetical protein